MHARGMRRGFVEWWGTIAVVALVAAGCGGDDSTDATEDVDVTEAADVTEGANGSTSVAETSTSIGGSDTTSNGGTSTIASPSSAPEPAQEAELEPGVTADAMRIGVILLNVSEEMREVIGIDSAFSRTVYQAYFDDLNARGGVAGRVVEPVFEELDLLTPTGAVEDRRVCLALTEDTQTFAILNSGGFDDEVPCIVTEHDTIFLQGQGFPEFQYEAAPNRLFSTSSSNDQLLRDLVAAMAPEWQGRRLGVVYEDAPGEEAIEDTLLPALEEAGVEVAHVTPLNDDSDLAVTEMPLEITQMSNAGVDAVLFLVAINNILNFISEADAQGFAPQYFASDYYGANVDSTAAFMPASFDGAMATAETRHFGEGPATDPVDLACFEILEAAGIELPEPGKLLYGEALSICGMVRVIEAGLTGAATPSRDGFADAIHSTGDIELPLRPVAEFGPDRNWAGGGSVQLLEFDSDCPCWRQVGDFQAVS